MSVTRPTISALAPALPVWRFVLLFQSWSQFLSWIVMFLGTTLLINWLLGLGKSNVLPLGALLAGTAFGSLVSVIMVLPAKFECSAGSATLLLVLQRRLHWLGYVQGDKLSNTTVYRQKLPKLLRWDEGQVLVIQTDGSFIVKGPYLITRKARRALLAS